MRATFLCDPNSDAFEADDREDVLLQYVYGIESLLLVGDREAIRDKIATRAALIAGRDDNERNDISAFVKRAYDARSVIAHGGEKIDNIDLRRLRDVCRRVFIVILSVARRYNSQDKLSDMIRVLPISRAAQDAMANDRDEVFPRVKAIESQD